MALPGRGSAGEAAQRAQCAQCGVRDDTIGPGARDPEPHGGCTTWQPQGKWQKTPGSTPGRGLLQSMVAINSCIRDGPTLRRASHARTHTRTHAQPPQPIHPLPSPPPPIPQLGVPSFTDTVPSFSYIYATSIAFSGTTGFAYPLAVFTSTNSGGCSPTACNCPVCSCNVALSAVATHAGVGWSQACQACQAGSAEAPCWEGTPAPTSRGGLSNAHPRNASICRCRVDVDAPVWQCVGVQA